MLRRREARSPGGGARHVPCRARPCLHGTARGNDSKFCRSTYAADDQEQHVSRHGPPQCGNRAHRTGRQPRVAGQARGSHRSVRGGAETAAGARRGAAQPDERATGPRRQTIGPPTIRELVLTSSPMASELRLMCVLAHPDDESMGTGGVLAKYASEGIATYVVTATRGERGRFGD